MRKPAAAASQLALDLGHRPALDRDDFEDELLQFPNGKYKDQADVLAYAGLIVVGRSVNAPNIRAATEEEMFEAGEAAGGLVNLLDDLHPDGW